MKCREVKKRLSEYVDGVLDTRREKLIREHIAKCKNCAEELRALQACVSILNSLQEIKAPEGFQEKVQQRIRERSVFNRIIRKIFLPLRVKIPLEVVGVAATVLLVISVFNVTESRKEVEKLTSILEQKPQKEADKFLSRKEKVASPRARSIPLSRKKMENIPVGQKAPVPASGTKKTLVSALTERKAGINEVVLVLKIVGKGNGSLKKEDKASRGISPGITPIEYNSKVLLKLKEIVKLAEGRILSVEYAKEHGRVKSITVQVPVKNLPLLAGKLNQVGTLAKSFSSLAVKEEKLIKLKINLQYKHPLPQK